MEWENLHVDSVTTRAKVIGMFYAHMIKNGRKEKRVVFRYSDGKCHVPEIGEMMLFARHVGIIEDEKYPGGKGRFKLLDCLVETLTYPERGLDEIANNHQLPIGEVLTNI